MKISARNKNLSPFLESPGAQMSSTKSMNPIPPEKKIHANMSWADRQE